MGLVYCGALDCHHLQTMKALLIILPGFLALRQGRQGRQLEPEMTSDMINIKMLSISVPGQPGQDYPILATVPPTSFRLQTLISHGAMCQCGHRNLVRIY